MSTSGKDSASTQSAPVSSTDPAPTRARETPEEALQREIAEELGAAVTVGELFETVDWSYPDKRVRLLFYRCAIEGEPRPLEGQEMAWVAPGDLGRYPFPPADATLIARLSRG